MTFRYSFPDKHHGSRILPEAAKCGSYRYSGQLWLRWAASGTQSLLLRKTIEPLEGSKPCHNSVITRFSGVSGLYLYVFIQIQRYYTRSNTVYQSFFSAICTVSNNNFGCCVK